MDVNFMNGIFIISTTLDFQYVLNIAKIIFIKDKD